MTALAPLAVSVLAVDWLEAGRVSLTGFLGVFVVLTLLYLTTLLFGHAARWVGWSGGGEDKKS